MWLLTKIAGPVSGMLLLALDRGSEQQPAEPDEGAVLEQPIEPPGQPPPFSRAHPSGRITMRWCRSALSRLTRRRSSSSRRWADDRDRRAGRRAVLRAAAVRTAYCSATASPVHRSSLRPWAEHLEADGFRVAAAPASWTRHDLAGDEPDPLAGLVRRRRPRVRRAPARAAIGSSWPVCRWAAALAIRLAEQHGDAVAGLAAGEPRRSASADPRMRALPGASASAFPRWRGSAATSPCRTCWRAATSGLPLHAAWSLSQTSVARTSRPTWSGSTSRC